MQGNEKVVVYSIGCPQCRMLEKKLAEKNVAYEIVTDIETIYNLGMKSVPVMEVDGVRHSFAESMKMLSQLKGV